MSDKPQVRLLTATDAAAYRAVRLAALQSDPLAFITTAGEFASRPLAETAARLEPAADTVNFGAFLAGELVGILALVREERSKLRHRGNIFGVAVLPEARGQGCGDALLRAGIGQARAWEGVASLHLGVMETQQAARRLYERHGFRLWGTQPDAVQDAGGQRYAEHHLALLL